MKLSERLGAVESEQAATPRRTAATPAPQKKTATSPRPQAASNRAAGPQDETPPEENKKRVRDMVLVDLGPRLTGSKRYGAELEKEVKAALDRALQREDVRISPVERSKFVAEVWDEIGGEVVLPASRSAGRGTRLRTP